MRVCRPFGLTAVSSLLVGGRGTITGTVFVDYINGNDGDSFAAHVGKVYTEVTGLSLPDRRAEVQAERTHVAWHHGHAHESVSPN